MPNLTKIRIPKKKQITAVDLFCGAGGMSTGVLEAFSHLGIECGLTAINHWPIAVETHGLNHPKVRHICEDISNVNPRKLFQEGGVNVLVGGPSCVSHSAARGGRPLDCDQDRATPWCMIRWAESTLPEIVLIENVPQFQKWGPLIRAWVEIKKRNPKTKEVKISRKLQWVPDKDREGETFKAWITCFESMGYTVEWKVLQAADYGDPTTRERLFVQATRGKRRPVWPKPTHRDGKLKPEAICTTRPWVKTRQIIDWTIPTASIFNRRKPLVDKTLHRVWVGFERYALPKIIEAEAARQENEKYEDLALASESAFIVKYKGTATAEDIENPMTTVQSSGKHHGLAQVDPKRVEKLEGEPYVVRYHGQSTAESVNEPISTIETSFKHYLAQTEAHRSAFVTVIDNQGKAGKNPTGGVRSVDEPTSTITSKARHCLIQGEARPIAQGKPSKTREKGENLAYLVKYFRTGIAKSIEEPLDTVTAKDRFGLVIPKLTRFDPKAEGLPKKGGFFIEVLGTLYEVDITLRMFEPHELSLAQGFPRTYRFAGNKTQQVRQIGNAVPRRTVRALTLASWTQNENVPFLDEFEDI